MDRRKATVLMLALAVLGTECRQLLAPNLAPSPLAGSQGILDPDNAEVQFWARVFRRYYSLSLTLSQRSGENDPSYEVIFLVANAAFSAAAAKNVEAAINSTASDSRLQETISYAQEAGSQTIRVTEMPAARVASVVNITAYVQVAGESAVEASNAAARGDYPTAEDAADKAAAAASSAVQQAAAALPPSPAPLDRPY